MLKRFSYLALIFLLITNCYASDFQGFVISSTDYALTDKWSYSDFEVTPLLSETDIVMRGERFSIFTFVGGFKLTNDGNSDIKFSLTVTAPDDSTYAHFDSLPGIPFKVDNSQAIFLSPTALGISFEPEDLEGSYIITAEVSDCLSGESLVFKDTVTMIPVELDNSIDSDSKIGEWLMNYYKDPKPSQAIQAFKQFCKSPGFTDIEMNGYSFFIEIFDNNNFLYPYLYSEIGSNEKLVDDNILRLLAIVDTNFTNSVKQIDFKDTVLINKLVDEKSKYDIVIVNRPVHLDMLWAKFFASGAYEPIKKIIESFEFGKYAGAQKKQGMVNDTTELIEDSWKDLTYQAAAWSVSSNIKNHQQVKVYCQYIYKFEEISDVTKQVLGIILDKN